MVKNVIYVKESVNVAGKTMYFMAVGWNILWHLTSPFDLQYTLALKIFVDLLPGWFIY